MGGVLQECIDGIKLRVAAVNHATQKLLVGNRLELVVIFIFKAPLTLRAVAQVFATLRPHENARHRTTSRTRADVRKCPYSRMRNRAVLRVLWAGLNSRYGMRNTL